MKSYDPLIEEKMQVFFEKAYKDDKREMATYDISRMIGEQLGEDSTGQTKQHTSNCPRNN
jgi:deoxyhypusine synthase